MIRFGTVLAFLFFSTGIRAQDFELEIQPLNLPGFPAIHSFACGMDEGEWILMGGRTNGLHGFQPPFAFPIAGQNDSIYVIDPDSQFVFSQSVGQLPLSLREQLSSSNMQFAQYGTKLFITGGYGFLSSSSDLGTQPYLIVVDLALLRQQIRQQSLNALPFQQIFNQQMAVTGGQMICIPPVFYLAGGHRFDGRYNPMNQPSFTQTYTYAIRQFEVDSSGSFPVLSNYSELVDSSLLRRRDYNLLPVRHSVNQSGFSIYSGVFRDSIDLPHTSLLEYVPGGSLLERSGFEQQFSHYHCARIPLYDSLNKKNYAVFMGGMAMFYLDSTGVLRVDSLVPFVNTISSISRDSAGSLNERIEPVSLPGFLGAAAEFIPERDILWSEHFIRLDRMDTARTRIGFFAGGLESDSPNIFMQGSGTSWASNQVFEIFLKRKTITYLQSKPFREETVKLYPNPANGQIRLEFELLQPARISVVLYDQHGKQIGQLYSGSEGKGNQELGLNLPALSSGQYIVQLMVNETSQSIPLSIYR